MALVKLMRNCVLLGLVRLIPLFTGFIPLNTMCLFSGSKLPRLLAIFYMLALVTISNMVVAVISGVNVFGSWCLFTYSAYILVTLLGTKLSKQYTFTRLIKFVCVASLIFWVWTNFGWWLTTSFYSKNSAGLLSCYIAALPYLRDSLIGNFCWAAIIFGTYNEKINSWWRSFWQEQLCTRFS